MIDREALITLLRTGLDAEELADLIIEASQAAWILANGPITDPGLVLDHLCRNRPCIRVDHLEPVSYQENSQRGDRKLLQTYCKRGHAMSGDNLHLYTNPRTGYVSRVCLACRLHYRQAAKTLPATAGK